MNRAAAARWLAHLLVLPALCVPDPVAAEHRPPRLHMIWQVSGERGEGWLVGSLHLGRGDMYPLPAVIDQAWEQTDELVVELDIGAVPVESMRAQMTRAGIYPNETRLDEHVPAATWKRVVAATVRLGVPVVLVQQQRPWLASVTLSLLQMSAEGWIEDLGLDRLFLAHARGRRPIVELETFAGQVALLAGLSPAEQVVMLEATLDDLDDEGASYDGMLDAWLSGDTAALDALIGGGLRALPGGRRVHRALIADRNVLMARRFVERLAAGARPLMIVGAGHLVGDTGVPALLREQGYEVRQASTPVAETDGQAVEQ